MRMRRPQRPSSLRLALPCRRRRRSRPPRLLLQRPRALPRIRHACSCTEAEKRFRVSRPVLLRQKLSKHGLIFLFSLKHAQHYLSNCLAESTLASSDKAEISSKHSAMVSVCLIHSYSSHVEA